ncbi:aspartate/methionine/tyrosine aminotransferase [Hydrogenivirga caldilitoris]|uniref:Aspartate/methionine/tyrosine aminotransferase n=1 Tax=Hydrogenivirga caldilitoris TaxID=246264 RepID=A0A497XV89_9AQUI|nr:pyridoxal phosphate-dependent aminotransferase [Hydrogenivirga caldilitoris]RLJ71072.1 aspartate/methionine/tyrosine aminotransferase [Hydrogenivirga caldilitoris]
MHRIDKLTPFIVMDILAKAKEMEDVIHLEIGEPDLDPSPKVLQALEKAIKDRNYFYTPALGLPELREKVAEFYRVKYGVDLSPDRVVITTGTSGAFLVAYAVTMDAGDRIALGDPSYPCYKNFAHLLDIQPEFIPISKETEYEIKPDMLKGRDVKALHISSPSNPTGNLYSAQTLQELADYCDREGIYLISDEIYHGLVYEGKEHTALEFSDRAIVINGFSKFFCMPGFRIGWAILPSQLVRSAEIVIQNVFISAPTLSQYAAFEAFDWEYLNRVRETFAERRETLYEGVKELFEVDAKPQGAFYIWANVSRYTQDSYEFALKLLEEAHVAVTPGVDFGRNRTNEYIRLAYTRDTEELREAVRRLKDFLSSL